MTSDKSAHIINHQLKRQENEWIEGKLADCEAEKGLDTGAYKGNRGEISAAVGQKTCSLSSAENQETLERAGHNAEGLETNAREVELFDVQL